eukprot:scaffold678_cov146-Skeletonema_menzelii.AAC.17
MPLPAPPAGLLAQIKKKSSSENEDTSNNRAPKPNNANALLAAIQAKQAAASASASSADQNISRYKFKSDSATADSTIPSDKLFIYSESHDDSQQSFLFNFNPLHTEPKLVEATNEIIVPLAPCVYRMTDYTYTKKEPILLSRCINKLNVLRCLLRECDQLNILLESRLSSPRGGTMEEDELGKTRFMELLSNCGVYQKISEMIIQRCNAVSDRVAKMNTNGTAAGDDNGNRLYSIPKVTVGGLSEFLQTIEDLVPSLHLAREEIASTQSVSFHPGLGELFSPGAKLVCYPEGMEGTPLGVSCVQSWYDEELNRATNKVKRRFILVVEFVVSVGTELVFVAASEVYPEFHDVGRNMPIRDLNHRRMDTINFQEDATLIQRLQHRGEFYASVGTSNHYLQYQPNAFFPIIGGWGNNAVRPLSKSGRVMVDVHRSFLEGHIPVRGSSDGMSDTVKEAMKLFDQSKRTGVAVPFRTARLPEFGRGLVPKLSSSSNCGDSDRNSLWMAWPMLTGFSFTARVWGKLLLSLPKASSEKDTTVASKLSDSPTRPSHVRLGVSMPALGGVGAAGNVNYINFQEKAFEQLVLDEDKKELIRAVARNAGGGDKYDFDTDSFDDDDDEEEEDDEIGLDVVANKGAASIFLLSGPPGSGKTLTAEAIAELLKKPLYVVTAGDLGITASEVEKSFGGVLDLCSTWDALVLVDEADIFLEARSSTEIQRNALVCVMLRLLEYYYGCLFLSSNRDAESIDAAIASRITVMLSYPPLDVEGRSKVWKNLIELVPLLPQDDCGHILPHIATSSRKISKYRMNFTAEDYKSLASAYQLNGRQIKNSIVLARALARERGVPLSNDVLKRAVTAVAGETCYL